MVWWLFKKKDDEERWLNLHESLTNSFKKIKEEIRNTHTKIDGKHDTHRVSIKELELKLLELEKKFESLSNTTPTKSIKEDILEEEFVDHKESEEPWDFLTTLQKSLLVNTSILSKENSQRWIAMKYLTQEIYPDKDYSKIRSLVSSYTENLVDLGLINKKRKGRQIFVSLTKKGQGLVPSLKNQIK
tara:strand:+ start:592 stop:1152 length:561 start_codon:yes stop_codon:yes gene_type:complete